jgi:hypothetical protein
MIKCCILRYTIQPNDRINQLTQVDRSFSSFAADDNDDEKYSLSAVSWSLLPAHNSTSLYIYIAVMYHYVEERRLWVLSSKSQRIVNSACQSLRIVTSCHLLEESDGLAGQLEIVTPM